jgi:hypothetical protein
MELESVRTPVEAEAATRPTPPRGVFAVAGDSFFEQHKKEKEKETIYN